MINEARLYDFEWNGLSTMLKDIEKTGDLKYSTMASEIITTAEEAMACDGEIHPDEQLEMDRLRKALRNYSFFTSMKNRLKRGSN